MLDSEAYNYLFSKDKTGNKVLQELTGLFYDRPSYTKGDQFDTAYKEGQRSVVEFILRQISQINFIPNQNTTEE